MRLAQRRMQRSIVMLATEKWPRLSHLLFPGTSSLLWGVTCALCKGTVPMPSEPVMSDIVRQLGVPAIKGEC